MREPKEIIIDGRTLEEILERHKHWLDEDCDGWEGMRACLSGSDLSWSNLSWSDLSGSNLRGSNLIGSNLSGSNLSGSNLSWSNLSGSDLIGSNLSGSNLSGSDLRGSDLRGAENIPYIPMTCPEEGDFIGWKKAYVWTSPEDRYPVIVKLRIPEDARRSSSTGRKCRCDRAEVLAIYDMDGQQIDEEARSDHDREFAYFTGDTVKVEDFDEDRWEDCSRGIHFFMQRREAELYA